MGILRDNLMTTIPRRSLLASFAAFALPPRPAAAREASGPPPLAAGSASDVDIALLSITPADDMVSIAISVTNFGAESVGIGPIDPLPTSTANSAVESPICLLRPGRTTIVHALLQSPPPGLRGIRVAILEPARIGANVTFVFDPIRADARGGDAISSGRNVALAAAGRLSAPTPTCPD